MDIIYLRKDILKKNVFSLFTALKGSGHNMQVLKERLVGIGNSNKFNWEYHNLDTGEKGIVQLESNMNRNKIVSVDNDINKFLSSGTICLKEILNETKR